MRQLGHHALGRSPICRCARTIDGTGARSTLDTPRCESHRRSAERAYLACPDDPGDRSRGWVEVEPARASRTETLDRRHPRLPQMSPASLVARGPPCRLTLTAVYRSRARQGRIALWSTLTLPNSGSVGRGLPDLVAARRVHWFKNRSGSPGALDEPKPRQRLGDCWPTAGSQTGSGAGPRHRSGGRREHRAGQGGEGLSARFAASDRAANGDPVYVGTTGKELDRDHRSRRSIGPRASLYRRAGRRCHR